jgi:hypothetical protein
MGGGVKKQVGGDLSTSIERITTYINTAITSLTQGLELKNKNIKIEYKFSLNIGRPKLVISVSNWSETDRKWTVPSTRSRTEQLPQISTLYSDIEKNYGADGNAYMFTPSLIEDLRLEIYHIAKTEANNIPLPVIDTATADATLVTDADIAAAAIAADVAIDAEQEAFSTNDNTDEWNTDNTDDADADVDIGIHTIFAKIIMKEIIDKFDIDHPVNVRFIKNIEVSAGNTGISLIGGSQDRKPEDVEIDVTLNRAAMKSTMNELTVLSRKHAEMLENYYGNDATDDNAYVEYLESKIALDKYYLGLYENKDLDSTYVNCTEEEFTKIFNDIENEVSEEKDKEMLNNSIKDNQNLIAQIKEDVKNEAAIKKHTEFKDKTFIEPDGKPLTDNRKHIPVKRNTGLTASEIAGMRNNENNEFNQPYLTGYGGKRRTKTMKSRKPSTTRTKKKRYATKTSHRKKTKNANRSKKNKTRRKRHY